VLRETDPAADLYDNWQPSVKVSANEMSPKQFFELQESRDELTLTEASAEQTSAGIVRETALSPSLNVRQEVSFQK